jgi:hypothetical protein
MQGQYIFNFKQSMTRYGNEANKCISFICNNSVTPQNWWFFKKKFLKVLKCYNFLRVQRRYNWSPAASFATCVMTLYPLKVRLQTFLSILITQKCQVLSCDTLVANERYRCSRVSYIINIVHLGSLSKECEGHWHLPGASNEEECWRFDSTVSQSTGRERMQKAGID